MFTLHAALSKLICGLDDSTREAPLEPWADAMTLYDRDVFRYYLEGVKLNPGYRVIALNTSEIANGLESTYTFAHWRGHHVGTGDLYFAIGKVKET